MCHRFGKLRRAGKEISFSLYAGNDLDLIGNRSADYHDAKNTGKEAMPLAAGLHPYFSIPLGPGGSRQQCRLAADAGRQWNLDVIIKRESYGNKPDDVFLAQPTLDLTSSKGTPLADTSLNHVFEARFPDNKTTSASVVDPVNNLKITVDGSRDFGTWVFFTPPNRSAISLEPWTLTPNGFNLAAAGIGDTGMQILEPGREWIGNVHIRCSPFEAQ